MRVHEITFAMLGENVLRFGPKDRNGDTGRK